MNKTLWLSRDKDKYFLSVDKPKFYFQSDGRTKFWSAHRISRISPEIAVHLLGTEYSPEGRILIPLEHTPYEILLTTK